MLSLENKFLKKAIVVSYVWKVGMILKIADQVLFVKSSIDILTAPLLFDSGSHLAHIIIIYATFTWAYFEISFSVGWIFDTLRLIS